MKTITKISILFTILLTACSIDNILSKNVKCKEDYEKCLESLGIENGVNVKDVFTQWAEDEEFNDDNLNDEFNEKDNWEDSSFIGLLKDDYGFKK